MQRVVFLLGYVIQLLVAVQFPESMKHDYKVSLKYPFNNTALGFHVGGDVTYSEKFIRISPSMNHKNGYVNSDRKLGYDNLMVDLVISVNGRGFVGGNGMGIWITDDIKAGGSGSYYGRNEDFKGF